MWESDSYGVFTLVERPDSKNQTLQTLYRVTLEPTVEGWLDVHVYPSPSGLSIYFRDITQRKEYE